MSSSLYAQLPQTAETQLAAKMSDLQSEVMNTHTRGTREDVNAPSPLSHSVLSVLYLASVQSKYKEDGIKSLSQSLYSQLPETAETQLAKTVSELQSEVTTTAINFIYLFVFSLVSSLGPSQYTTLNTTTVKVITLIL